MELAYRKATITDSQFIFECFGQLMNNPIGTLADFQLYYKNLIHSEYGKNDIWICENNGVKCGYILVNHLACPRYRGYIAEMEEVVISPSFQRKGIGRTFLIFLLSHYRKDDKCRKMIVKTNDIMGSGLLYGSILNVSDMQTYQLFLNKI